ncbi:MAG: hypothetical protein WD716_11965 [Fimbriimonadaceae bacterium]
MKYRFITAILATAAAALAVAGLVTIWSVTGHGTVGNTTSVASFVVDAARTARGTTLSVHGRFVLDFSTTTHAGNRLVIHVHNYELATVPNTVRISGPAVYRYYAKGAWHETTGVGSAVLTSNRHPGEPGDPDAISVRFQSPTLPTVFEFHGAVRSGDVTVAKTESY